MQWHPARLPTKGEGLQHGSLKTESCRSGGPHNPHPCLDTTLLQAGGVSLCSIGWVQGEVWVWGWGAAGPELVCSIQRLPKPQVGDRGRWVPQVKERGCLCWGCNQSGSLIILVKSFLLALPLFFFFLS